MHLPPPAARHKHEHRVRTCVPTLHVNLASPAQQAAVLAATMAGVPVVLQHDATRAVVSVSCHDSAVDGTLPVMMFLARHAATTCAVLALDDDMDETTTTPDCGGRVPLCPSDPTDFATALRVVALASDLVGALRRRATAEIRDIPAAKMAIDAALCALENAVHDVFAAASSSPSTHRGSNSRGDGAFLFGPEPSFADAAVIPALAAVLLATMGGGLDQRPQLWQLYVHTCRALPDVADLLQDHAFDFDAWEAASAVEMAAAK